MSSKVKSSNLTKLESHNLIAAYEKYSGNWKKILEYPTVKTIQHKDVNQLKRHIEYWRKKKNQTKSNRENQVTKQREEMIQNLRTTPVSPGKSSQLLSDNIVDDNDDTNNDENNNIDENNNENDTNNNINNENNNINNNNNNNTINDDEIDEIISEFTSENKTPPRKTTKRKRSELNSDKRIHLLDKVDKNYLSEVISSDSDVQKSCKFIKKKRKMGEDEKIKSEFK